MISLKHINRHWKKGKEVQIHFALICLCLLGIHSYSGQIVITQSQVKELLGKDNTGKIIYVSAVDGKAYFADFSEEKPVEKSLCKITSIKSPLISPDGKSVTFWTGEFKKGGGTSGEIYVSTLTENASPVKIGTGIEPHWFIHPENNKTFLVYRTNAGKYYWPNLPGKTMKQEINPITYQKIGGAQELAAKSFGGGLSKSGRYLLTAYASAVLYDLQASKGYVLNKGRQTCNASISPYSDPEKEHWSMILVLAVSIGNKSYASHEVFTIYDKNDDLKWFIQKPPGTKEWQNPEWSTHENFCTATAQQSDNSYHVYIIRISDKKAVKVVKGNYRVPHLWVSSSVGPPVLESPAISPAGGNFSDSVKVTLSGPAGAEIFYTDDGVTVPTRNSIPYTGPFFLSKTSTILARAFMDGRMSDVARALITIGEEKPPDSLNTQKSITLLKPNGGEQYQVGDKISITWKTDETKVNDVWILLSTTGSDWIKLSEKSIGVESDEWGEFPWTVLGEINGVQLAGKPIHIRVENYHNHTQFDTSDAAFYVLASAIGHYPNAAYPFTLKEFSMGKYMFTTDTPHSVFLHNLTGETLFQKKITGRGTLLFPLNKLPDGKYLIRVRDELKKSYATFPVLIK